MSKAKIVVTLGPACDSEATIMKMIKLGASLFGFNTKHNNLNWHNERINRVRKIVKSLNQSVTILLNLRGPELRVDNFPAGQIKLAKDELIHFVEKDPGNGEKKIVIEELKSIIRA